MKTNLFIFSVICLVALGAQSALAGGRLVVFGVDESGSYHLRQQGLGIAKAIINQMQGDDILYLRRITGRSYQDQESAILRLALRAAPAEPKNPFDRTNRKKRQMVLRSNSLVKKRAALALDSIKHVKADRTDIWGFFFAAQDRLEAEGERRERLVILASDMRDNVGHKGRLNLHGARVLILGFQKQESPQATRQLRSHWKESLKNAGASVVVFQPADVPVRLEGKESSK